VIKGHINLDITVNDIQALAFEDHFQTYQQLPAIERYYTAGNSSIWQMFHEESPAWCHKFINKIPQDFDHAVLSIIRIDPGQTIPLHIDKHYWVQQTYGQGKTHRYLIMLEDWKSGHYFELEKEPLTNWKAGDWIRFEQAQWHLASNAGIEPWYSAQVTCVVKNA